MKTYSTAIRRLSGGDTPARKGRKPATAATTIPCAVYTRKSVTKGLDQTYNTLEAQEDKCRAYIGLHSQEGWQYAATYCDAGISGGTTNRPELRRMLADAEAGRIRQIVVYKLDRLSRTQLDLLAMLERLAACGVEVASVSEQFDTSTPGGRAMRNLLGVFAQMEREMISERTRAKFDAARRKGYIPSGKPPIGYVRKGVELLPDGKHAGTVREMFRMAVAGRMTFAQMAESLNTRGMACPKADGSPGKWDFRSVSRVLHNPVYAGYVPSPEGELFDGLHTPLVERGDWLRLKDRLNAAASRMRQRMAGKAGRARRDPLPLEGIIRCGCCGKPLAASFSAGDRHRYYACPSRRKKHPEDRCQCPILNADETDRFVMAQLAGLAENRYLVAAVASRLPNDDALSVKQCLANIDRLMNYCDPAMMREVFALTFEGINYDWENGRMDFKFRKEGES